MARQSSVRPQSRLLPGGAAAAGGSAGVGRAHRAAGAACAPTAPQPWSPFQARPSHSPRASGPRSRPGRHGTSPSPAPPRSQVVAHDASPGSHSPGRPCHASRSLCKRETVRRAKGESDCRGAWRVRGPGVCVLPHALSPAVACVSSCVESPAPAVTGLFAFSCRRG